MLSSIDWVRDNAPAILDALVILTILSNTAALGFARFGLPNAEKFARGLSTSFSDLWQAGAGLSKKKGQLEPPKDGQ